MSRLVVAIAAAVLAASTAAAEVRFTGAKFISFSPDGAPETRILGEAGLPQVGDAVPDGPKRIRARVSDATLKDYARASLLALEVYARYDRRIREAQTRHDAQMIASSANGELAAVLNGSGVMDHATFLRMTNALNADAALARRARDVAERVLAR